MLSKKSQQKILQTLPINSSIGKALKLLFKIKNFLFELKNRIWLIIFRLRNCFLSYKPIISEFEDISFKLVPKGAIALKIWREGEYEKFALRFLLSHMKPGIVFFDIGANIGIFSILSGLKEKNIEIYTFEPASETFKVLKENIKLNNLQNIKAFQIGIGDYRGKAVLKINARWSDGLNTIGRATHPECKIVGKEEILITTLDDFIKEHSVKKVDIMKVDVEGAELLVFQGAKKLLRCQEAPLILYESRISNAKGFGYHPVEIMWCLRDLGYKLFDLDEETGKISPFLPVRHYDATIIALKPNHPLFKGLILKDKTD
ncbi:FkbM family methyltransferase [bacterium]|nr:FkbM family methyltransferase [bacterium]